jgi:hypothetical protein
MKIKAAAVMELVEKNGRVTVADIQKKFDIDDVKAWRVIQAMCERNLLMPLVSSIFAPPEGGHLPPFKSNVNPTSDWYKSTMKKFWSFYDEREGVGVSIYDVTQGLELGRAAAVKILMSLTEDGTFITRASEHGGVYGQRPRIFGRNEDELRMREILYQRSDREKSKKRKARS